ncbi:MAG: TIGR00282 family metallophosphoesterase [Candidatus Eisenbacteria bacterium]|nr:TIGR00282 family metallophosphoesterase [Candidatus Eisenbacteria bacterium]
MRILFIGDIIGRPGRRLVQKLLPGLRAELELDFVVANAENIAAGAGITGDCASEMFDVGVNVLTGGNHIWDKEEGIAVVDRDARIVRPVNYPPGTPGRGLGVYPVGEHRVAVVSVLGQIFMNPPLDCPFRAVDGALTRLAGQAGVVLVDVHAEATSEKIALCWYLDGRVSAVLGTHTHVQTADERILPRGTAALTDVGMTGPRDSIIGVRKELALRRMLSSMPVRFQTADGDPELQAVPLEVDPGSGRAGRIERIRRT